MNEYRELLGCVLAVIHGDGGHREEKIGAAAATAEAIDKYRTLIRRDGQMSVTEIQYGDMIPEGWFRYRGDGAKLIYALRGVELARVTIDGWFCVGGKTWDVAKVAIHLPTARVEVHDPNEVPAAAKLFWECFTKEAFDFLQQLGRV